MLTLEKLLQALEELSIDPKEIPVSGVVYDSVYQAAEAIVDEDQEDSED
ncbi:hypothetical protein ACFLVS_05495 [Chloroflexota bacterium]